MNVHGVCSGAARCEAIARDFTGAKVQPLLRFELFTAERTRVQDIG
jgi:hypothetical protein